MCDQTEAYREVMWSERGGQRWARATVFETGERRRKGEKVRDGRDVRDVRVTVGWPSGARMDAWKLAIASASADLDGAGGGRDGCRRV